MAAHAHQRRLPARHRGEPPGQHLPDGLFHASTYAFVAAGLAVRWRSARRTHLRWSGKLLLGSMLMGSGLFTVVEGLVDHHLLGLHHANETAPRERWPYWDVGFLLRGAAMLAGGWLLLRAGKRESAGEARRLCIAERPS